MLETKKAVIIIQLYLQCKNWSQQRNYSEILKQQLSCDFILLQILFYDLMYFNVNKDTTVKLK